MNKMLSFLAGAFSGAIVGATAAILLAPASGEDLRSEMVKRWDDALEEAKQAMEQTRLDLQNQFEQMQKGDYQE
jgi:gas vesicle protein